MKLRYYLKNKEKIYTMNENAPNSDEKTKDAHYKYVKIRSSIEKD